MTTTALKAFNHLLLISIYPAIATLAAIASPASASAQEGQASSAEALFAAARADMEAGKYEQACPKFADSHRLDPGVGTLLNLGLCHEELGKTASAWSTFREAAALARQQGQIEREEFARGKADDIEARLTRIEVRAPEEVSSLQGLKILREDHELPLTLLGVAEPVDPGKYRIVVSAPGHSTFQTQVATAGPGQTATVDVPRLRPAPPTKTEPVQESSVEGAGPGPWILAGAGLASLATGATLSFVIQDKSSQAADICPDFPKGSCSRGQVDRHAALVDEARNLEPFSYIAWGAGAAAVVGATTWFLIRRPKKEEAISVLPSFHARGAAVVARGRF